MRAGLRVCTNELVPDPSLMCHLPAMGRTHATWQGVYEENKTQTDRRFRVMVDVRYPCVPFHCGRLG